MCFHLYSSHWSVLQNQTAPVVRNLLIPILNTPGFYPAALVPTIACFWAKLQAIWHVHKNGSMVYYNEGKQKVRSASQNIYLTLYLKFQVTTNAREQSWNMHTHASGSALAR